MMQALLIHSPCSDPVFSEDVGVILTGIQTFVEETKHLRQSNNVSRFSLCRTSHHVA